jgi:hypothetical protein
MERARIGSGAALAWALAGSLAAPLHARAQDPGPSAADARGAKITAPRLEGAPDVGTPGPSAAALGLERQDDGAWIYVDPGGRFSARIEDDGSVRFGDRWRRPDDRDARRPRPERGRCCGAPAEGFGHAVNALSGAPVSGPSEWAFRLRGHDPVAAAKAQMLARTRPFRARLAVAWHKGVLATRLSRLPGELERLWTDPDLSAQEKRRMIFRRWDECEDALVVPVSVPVGGDALSRARADAAARARKAIERFVRVRLPAGHAQAFDPEELARLNSSRQSREPFDPYARAPEPTT